MQKKMVIKPERETKYTFFLQTGKQIVNLPIITILVIFFLSALFQAAGIASSYFWAKSLHIPLDLSFFFITMPIVYFATVLPVSLGGLGVREGAIVYFLTSAGVASTEAAVLSFAIYLNSIIVGVVGGALQITWKSKIFDSATLRTPMKP